MFIISIEGKKQLFLNALTDDFIRLLPKQFDCEESDIEAFYVTEKSQKEVRKEMRAHPERNYFYDLDNYKLVYLSVNADDEMIRNDAVTLEVQRVLKITTKPSTNSITGLSETVQDQIILDENVLVP